MPDCIFCTIIEKKIPSSIIYEDKGFIAFLDIAPVNKGHSLVAPKQHYESLLSMPPKLLQEFSVVSQKIAGMIKKNLHADGINFLVNNDRAAGQEVMHVHQHIIPRFINDGFRFLWPHQKYAEGEMAQVVKQIAASSNKSFSMKSYRNPSQAR